MYRSFPKCKLILTSYCTQIWLVSCRSRTLKTSTFSKYLSCSFVLWYMWHMWSDFVLKWSASEVKWVTLKFLGTKVPWTLGWPYTKGTWLYCDYFIWCVSSTVFVLTCFVICSVCMCVFCNVWACVCVGFLMSGCFGNLCTCICCDFVLFRLRIFILICY
jgi:hypothetical protein